MIQKPDPKLAKYSTEESRREVHDFMRGYRARRTTVVVQPSAGNGWDVSIGAGVVQTHTRKRDAVIDGRRLARHLDEDLIVRTPSGREQIEPATEPVSERLINALDDSPYIEFTDQWRDLTASEQITAAVSWLSAVVVELETADIDCPYCGAPAGFPCNAEREGEFLVHIHRARAEAE